MLIHRHRFVTYIRFPVKQSECYSNLQNLTHFNSILELSLKVHQILQIFHLYGIYYKKLIEVFSTWCSKWYQVWLSGFNPTIFGNVCHKKWYSINNSWKTQNRQNHQRKLETKMTQSFIYPLYLNLVA